MRWRGLCGSQIAPIQGEHELFGFLTTEANAAMARVHPKAMPVILRRPGRLTSGSRATCSMRSCCRGCCLRLLAGLQRGAWWRWWSRAAAALDAVKASFCGLVADVQN
jgi:hypothetical protein